MATQYSNKPIVTNGLVYALDFGNQKSYVSGSSSAFNLRFSPIASSVVSTGGLPLPPISQGKFMEFLRGSSNNTGSYITLNLNATFMRDLLTYNKTHTVFFTGIQKVDTNLLTTGRLPDNVLTFNRQAYDYIQYNGGNIYTNEGKIKPGRIYDNPSQISVVAHRQSSGSFDYYVNGVPQIPSSVASAGLVGTVPTISGRPEQNDALWSGSLGAVLIYNRALTDDEIWQNTQVLAPRYNISIPSNKPYAPLDQHAYLFLSQSRITDPIITSSIDTFVKGLKSASLWDKMFAIYPFVGTGSVGVNLTGSHIWNLKEPAAFTYGLTFSGSWNGSTSGSTPSGSNTYITANNLGIGNQQAYSTPILPGNVHMSILSYDTPVSNSYLMGTGMTEDLAISTLAGDYGTPAAAYSVRKVRTAYSGALMDVRRSYDNVTQSIGYVANGDLDTGSLLDWTIPGRNTLPGAYSGLAAAYSLRRVSGSYTGSAIDVRRIWDNTTSSIGFDSNGNLDTGSLLNFTTSGSNILPYSNDFTQADWAKYDIQVTASAILGPFGLGSGSFINETTVNSIHLFNENINPVNTSSIHTISCFIKKQERRYAGLAFAYNGANYSYVTFDLDTTSSISSGSVGTGYSVASSSINYVTDGWFRISLTGTVGLNDFYPRFYLTKDTTGYAPSYVGEPGTGSYIYGFQYTTGSTLQPYIETTGTARYNVGNTSSFGYVTQWYDQSGNNRHATQTATGSQPLIVSSGSLVTENGKPALRFIIDNSSSLSLPGSPLSGSNAFGLYAVANFLSVDKYEMLYAEETSGNIVEIRRDNLNNTLQWSTGVGTVPSGTASIDNRQILVSVNRNALVSNSAFVNGTLDATSTTSSNSITSTTASIGKRTDGFYFDGTVQEMSFFTGSAASSSRSLIENNINNYYNIYTGSNHGFVARWYDQSGNNRHASQTATGSQPMIVLSGSIITENSRSALSFDGTSMFFNLSSNITATSPFSSFAVGRRSSNGTAMLFYGGSGVIHGLSPDDKYYLQKSTGYLQSNNTDTTNQQILLSGIATTATQSQFKNSLEIASTFTAAGIATTVSKLGYYVDASPYYFNGKYQELSLYLTDQSSNRQPIEYGINSYYNIYPQTSSFATSSFAIYTTSGSVSASLNNKLTSGIASSGPLGLITVSRTGSNSLTIAKNSSVATYTVPSSGALSTGIYLGAINNNGLALGNSPLGISFASVGTGLTNSEVRTYEQLVSTLYFNLGRGDIDASAFINAAQITSSTQITAINTLVRDLKAYNIWPKLKAVYPFVGGTSGSHKFNLIDPRDLDVAYRLNIPSSGWNHTSLGMQLTNSSVFADTYLIPSEQLSQNSKHMMMYQRNNLVNRMMGANDASQRDQFQYSFGAFRYNLSSAQNGFGSYPQTNNGFLLTSRIDSTGTTLYRNGVFQQFDGLASTGNPTGSYRFGEFTGASYGTGFFSFGSFGDGLTATEVANYYIAVQAFQTALGRQL